MNLMDDPVVIVEALRTPIGHFQSALKDYSAVELGRRLVKSMMHMTELSNTTVDEVIMGTTLQAGLGQCPARQVAIGAGLAKKTRATTVNKVCGSGMQAIMMGVNQILLGQAKVVIAGGMESMSNAPLLTKRPGRGEEMPENPTYRDHLFHDGLYDACSGGAPMGLVAEETVEKYGFTREDQDKFAYESWKKASNAQKNYVFDQELTPIFYDADCTRGLESDEPLERTDPKKIPSLKPAFKKDGTITAASASSLADGAAAVMMMSLSEARQRHLTPLVSISGWQSVAMHPRWFTLAPTEAMRRLDKHLEWGLDNVGLFEVNEAFAVVPMAAQRELNINDERMNVHGGACAVGHPLAASSARIVVAMAHNLRKYKLRYGMSSVCIGGGEGLALGFERVIIL